MTRAATAADRRLDELIEEATVDAHDESEQAVGFHAVIEENVAFPFRTEVLGIELSVTGVDMRDDDRVVAICKRGRQTQHIDLADLPLPSQPPAGAEWIAAYWRWSRSSG